MAAYNEFKSYALSRWEFNGNSAKCLYGIHVNNPMECNYPLDPDDLCRCIQVLRFMFGEYEGIICQHHIEKVAEFYQSDVWIRYACDWDKLIEIFKTEWELPSAPKTYALMQKIIEGK